MKRIFTIVIISILFFACKAGIPKDILQPNEMEKILLEVHIVDGYISVLPSQDSAKRVASAYYKGIYKKFGIDSILYNKSLDYYYKHPPVLKKMYDTIALKLTKLKDRITISEELQNSFKGIFAKDGLDSTVLDYNLNKKYNYRPLRGDVYINFMSSNFTPSLEIRATPANEQIVPPATQQLVKSEQKLEIAPKLDLKPKEQAQQ